MVLNEWIPSHRGEAALLFVGRRAEVELKSKLLKVFYKISFFFIIGILLCLPSFGQKIKGKVVDEFDRSGVKYVIVRNKRVNQLEYSDENGRFEIVAQAGDTLLFFSQGYEPQRKIASLTLFKDLEVVMQRKSHAIEDINIRPDWTPYQLDSIERRAIYRGTLEQHKESSALSPISVIADRLSRKSRRKWKFQMNYEKWERQKFMDTKYSVEEVKELTGLKGDSVGLFMTAFPIPYDYARTASDIEIKMWIKNNYHNWIKKETKEE